MDKLDFTVKPDCEAFTSDFWYDIAYGGHLKPKEILANEKTAQAVEDAVKVLKAFREACEEQIEWFIR